MRREGRTYRDAVHGAISFHRTPLLVAPGLLDRLIGTSPLERMGRIRQLPFATPVFPSATHTRLAHAIGSAHMALAICERLAAIGWFEEWYTKLKEAFGDPGAIEKFSEGSADHVTQAVVCHVVVAALLQDLGELPYKQVLQNFIGPHPDLISGVTDRLDLTGGQTASWPMIENKAAFTLDAMTRVLDEIPAEQRPDTRLLTYLIAGLEPDGFSANEATHALRRILDGSVDADRLDYVIRDSYHTIGLSSSGQLSAQVTASISGLNENGLIFDDPTAVSLLLLQRAVLRSEVFAAPDIRLGSTLLAVVLSGLMRTKPEKFDKLLGSDEALLSSEAFGELDDRRIDDALTTLMDGTVPNIGNRAKCALRVLASAMDDYEPFWLPKSDATGDDPAHVYDDVFFDTLFDIEHHVLYTPGSVLISGRQWAIEGPEIPLEATGSHVAEFMTAGADSDPVRARYLCFVPQSRRRWAAERLEECQGKPGPLYAAAIARDAETSSGLDDDTSRRGDFRDPVIFVSYCAPDMPVLRRLLAVLKSQRRKYAAYAMPASGAGGTARENSRQIAQTCGAALLVLSREYIARAVDNMRNVSIELQTLMPRAGEIPITVVSAEEHAAYDGQLETIFPWSALGFDTDPFTGPGLAMGSARDYHEVVEECLKRIDSFTPAA